MRVRSASALKEIAAAVMSVNQRKNKIKEEINNFYSFKGSFYI